MPDNRCTLMSGNGKAVARLFIANDDATGMIINDRSCYCFKLVLNYINMRRNLLSLYWGRLRVVSGAASL
ncbi:MAG: hypothetical protein EPN89_12720 [Methylovulum sp.]|nr:MAG: hypothetical protein EPN89_12720 [Methylovulum sp.]